MVGVHSLPGRRHRDGSWRCGVARGSGKYCHRGTVGWLCTMKGLGPGLSYSAESSTVS